MEKQREYLKAFDSLIEGAVKIMREVALAGNKLFYKIIEFPLKIITVLGIFAGFGFTGISQVKNIWPFILGEACFSLSVVIGLIWYKQIVINHMKVYKDYIKNIDDYITELERIKKENITEDSYNDEKLKEDMTTMQKKQSKIFEERPKGNDLALNAIILIFIIGIISLLFSFLPINFSLLKI